MTLISPLAIATIVISVTGVWLIVMPRIIDTPTRFIWNVSASAPIGLYSVQPATSLSVGDLVVVVPPEHLRDWLVGRGYLAPNVPLIKRIAALQGQTVCRNDLLISIDGTAVALAREHDRQERPLTVWSGCHTLVDEEVFLLNQNAPDSLDGRYFGPTHSKEITGRLMPLWTAERP